MTDEQPSQAPVPAIQLRCTCVSRGCNYGARVDTEV
jgi:hypothetical protein